MSFGYKLDKIADYLYEELADKLFYRSDKTRDIFLITLKLGEYVTGLAYYGVKNNFVRLAGFFTGKESYENYSAGLPWKILHLGEEKFISCRERAEETRESLCMACDNCPYKL